MSVVGLDELKEYLKVTVDTDDAVIEELRDSAVALVENWTGDTYPDAGNVTEFLKGYGTEDLFLHMNPTADPTSVKEHRTPGDTGTVITAAQSDGWVRRDSRLVRKGGAVWQLGFEYEVAYAGGYVHAPADVQLAVKRIVRMLHTERTTGGMQSETLGKYAYEVADSDSAGSIEDVLKDLPRRGVFA